MSRAAAELHTVQSNVTARIRVLEDELGTALFDRSSRGVVLTAAGRRLVPYASRMRRLLDDARRAAIDDGTPRGPLVVGSLETTAAVRLSPVLATYAATYPSVDVSLLTGTTSELTDAVLEHRVEGAFVCGPVRHAELAEDTMFREELVLVTARRVRSLEDVVRDGDVKIIVLRAGCSYRERLEAMLKTRGVVGIRRLEFGTIDGIVGCVHAGLGVTLLPRSLVTPASRDGRVAIHDLPPAEAHVETVFIRRQDGYLSSALSAFLDCARPSSIAMAAITS